MTQFLRSIILTLFLTAFILDTSSGQSISPPNETNKRMLFIGQDLNSINGYLENCESCPAPDGFVTYLSLGSLTQKDFYGALGFTKGGKQYSKNVDWGAGPLNAYSLVQEHPGKRIQIGLYMVDLLRKISRGELNQHIKQLARFFQEFPQTTFYLRIGYEFDGKWNHYDPGEYVAAFQYIVDLLRKKKVENVQYVWHASASPVDDLVDGYKEDIMRYYPGDQYVDWMAISWFLPPTVGPEGSSQQELADEMANIARQKGKPLMIAESANQGYSNSELTKRNIAEVLDGPSGKNPVPKSPDEIWEAWYAPFFGWMEANGDVLKGLSYINAHWDSQQLWAAPYSQGYWGDSRIEVQAEIRQRWIAEFEKAFWGK